MTSEEAPMRTPEELNALCERAGAHKRRQLAERGLSDFRLGFYVYHRQVAKDRTPNADGWVHLSDLIDAIHKELFVIWWEPTTDRLRLERT
jgi:hypothetical protein